MAQNDVDIRSAVSWEEAERFIDEADLEFRIFVGRYRHFGPWEIIGRWCLSRIPGVRQSSEKPEDACQQRAADLLGHFHDAFGTAKWREFKFHKEYLSHSTHLPFPHGFVYLELRWLDSLADENNYYRIYDPYRGIIAEDWEP